MDAMIGVLIAGLVMLISLKTFTGYEEGSSAAVLAATTASEWVQVNTAATSYIQANAAAIQAIATPTTPATITIAMLESPAVALLPASFNALDPYNQTWEVQVLQPTSGNLQALVLTVGGESLKDKQVAQIANLVGATGGFIPRNDSRLYPSGYAYGVASSWKVPTAGYSASPGELAALITVGNGQAQSPFVYRNSVPGQPQLNAMNTPLVMDSVQIVGGACSTVGAIAQDGTGIVLSCQGGTWQSQGGAYWKNPVATYTDLPGGDAVGAVRMTTDKGNAFMWTGAAWFPMGIDQNGNITIPNSVIAANGKVTIWNQPTEGGVLQLDGLDGVRMFLENLNGTFRLVNSAWNAQLFSVDQSGNVVAAGTMQPGTAGGQANPGWGCSPNGQLAANANGSGQSLVCENSVWTAAGGATQGLAQGDYCPSYQSCGAGAGWRAGTCSLGGGTTAGRVYWDGRGWVGQLWLGGVTTLLAYCQSAVYF